LLLGIALAKVSYAVALGVGVNFGQYRLYTGCLLVIQPASWYEPQYLIPLAGIVLGNAMNGAAIAGERTHQRQQTEIETHLSLGATPASSGSVPQRRHKAGLIPPQTR